MVGSVERGSGSIPCLRYHTVLEYSSTLLSADHTEAGETRAIKRPWPTHKVGCSDSPETVLVGGSAGLLVRRALPGWVVVVTNNVSKVPLSPDLKPTSPIMIREPPHRAKNYAQAAGSACIRAYSSTRVQETGMENTVGFIY